MQLIFLLFFLFLSGKAESQQIIFEPYLFKSGTGVEVQAERGKFLVPENRLNKGSRQIPIYFLRLPCTGATKGAPIVYLAGGPGGSSVRAAQGPRFELINQLRKFGDVLLYEQRGIAWSNSLPRCDADAQMNTSLPGTETMYLEVITRNVRKCMKEYQASGIDVGGYNILQNAMDIEELRNLLAVDKITMMGISFGTQLAFAYNNLFEERIDRLILASLEALDQNIKFPRDTEDLLERIQVSISMDTASRDRYPGLIMMMRNVLRKMESHPVTVSITDNNSISPVGLSKLDVQLVTSYILLKNPSDISSLPYHFKLMEAGNFSQIAPLVIGLKRQINSLNGMPFYTDAMTGVDKQRLKAVYKQAEMYTLGRTTNFPFPEAADEINLPDIGEQARKLKRSKNNGIFLSGDLDGRTFLSDAIEIKKKFPNVKHVIVQNGGHDLFEASPLIRETIMQYMGGVDVDNRINLKPVKYINK